MRSYLHEVQTVNGADDRFLFTALVVSDVSRPTEKISSRLRAVIVVAVVGIAVVFGAVSVGKWVEMRRSHADKASRGSQGTTSDPGDAAPVDDGTPEPAVVPLHTASNHEAVEGGPVRKRRSRTRP